MNHKSIKNVNIVYLFLSDVFTVTPTGNQKAPNNLVYDHVKSHLNIVTHKYKIAAIKERGCHQNVISISVYGNYASFFSYSFPKLSLQSKCLESKYMYVYL